MVILKEDTTSYPNMKLIVESKDGENISGYTLIPNEGYLIHNHESCFHGDEENGIPAQCYYAQVVGLAPSMDLSSLNDKYVAVERSTLSKGG